MQFVGQTHLIRVPVAAPDLSNDDLRALFEKAYFARFRVALDTIRPAVVNVNTSVIGTRTALDLSALIDPAGRKPAPEPIATRAVSFDGPPVQTPVYWRDHLPLDVVLSGPAIVQQMDTTVLIEPDCTARSDAHGNLLIDIGASA